MPIKVDHHQLIIIGEACFDTVTALLAEGKRLMTQSSEPNLCVDLSQITRCDISLLSLMLAWLRHANGLEKTLAFHEPPSHLLSIANVCGVKEVFEWIN